MDIYKRGVGFFIPNGLYKFIPSAAVGLVLSLFDWIRQSLPEFNEGVNSAEVSCISAENFAF
jgi:hypothetical protein